MYRCSSSFTSTTGKQYYSGQTISSLEYNLMPAYERGHFYAIPEEKEPEEDNPVVSMPMPDILDSDPLPSPNDEFNGFGGGDGGGAGASGEW